MYSSGAETTLLMFSARWVRVNQSKRPVSNEHFLVPAARVLCICTLDPTKHSLQRSGIITFYYCYKYLLFNLLFFLRWLSIRLWTCVLLSAAQFWPRWANCLSVNCLWLFIILLITSVITYWNRAVFISHFSLFYWALGKALRCLFKHEASSVEQT